MKYCQEEHGNSQIAPVYHQGKDKFMADAETAGNAGNHHQTEYNQGNFAGKNGLRVYKQVIAACDCNSQGKKDKYCQEGIQY